MIKIVKIDGYTKILVDVYKMDSYPHFFLDATEGLYPETFRNMMSEFRVYIAYMHDEKGHNVFVMSFPKNDDALLIRMML